MARSKLGQFTFGVILLISAALVAEILFAVVHPAKYLSTKPQVIFYLLIPGTLLALSLWSLRRSETERQNFILSLGSVIFTLYFLEVFLFSPRFHVVQRLQGIDARSILEVVRDARKNGKDYYPNFQVWLDENQQPGRFVLSAAADKTVVICNESGKYLTMETDELGFRNPRGWTKKWKRPDVVILEDSFAEGYCVGENEMPSALLKKEFPQTVSLGKSGMGPLRYLAVFREYVAELQPKHVVLFYYSGNDLYDFLPAEDPYPIYEELKKYLERRHLDSFVGKRPEMQKEYEKQLEEVVAGYRPPPFFDPYYSLGRFLRLYQIRSFLNENFLAPRLPEYIDGHRIARDAVPQLMKILGLTRGEVEKWSGDFVVVYLPSWGDFSGDPNRASPQGDEILRSLAAKKFKFIDGRDLFRKSGDPLRFFPYRKDGHYTAEGYRLLTEQIAGAIAR